MNPRGYVGFSGFHKYWGKKPVEAWRFLIKKCTKENEIVLDPFLGSGLIARECASTNRRFVGFDINPISIELTKLFVNPPTYTDLLNAYNDLTVLVRDKVNSLYSLENGTVISHFLWNEKNIEKAWIKTNNRRQEILLEKNDRNRFQHSTNFQPKKVRTVRLFDNSRINSKSDFSLNDLFSSRALISIDLFKEQIETYEETVRRALLLILSASLGQMSNMVFAVTKRGKTKGSVSDRIEVGSWVIGYWCPRQHFEVNTWNCFENKARKLLNAVKVIRGENHYKIATSFEEFQRKVLPAYVQNGDSESLLKDIPSETVKVILTDPPHGDRIPYLELSEMWNCVLSLDVSYDDELVVSNATNRNKGTEEYQKKLSVILGECDRVLRLDGLMAVMFNARMHDHWSSLRSLEANTSLKYLGCYPMEYSARSVVQDNREGGLKTDYVLLYQKCSSMNQRKCYSNDFKMIPGWSPMQPMAN